MFETLTHDQILEMRAALHQRFDSEYSAHSERLQALVVGSAEMAAELAAWETRRDDIKAAQAAVEAAIETVEQKICPKAIRRGRK